MSLKTFGKYLAGLLLLGVVGYFLLNVYDQNTPNSEMLKVDNSVKSIDAPMATKAPELPETNSQQSVKTPVLASESEIVENVAYGIKSDDSLGHVEIQAKKYGFLVSTKAVNSEAGEEVGYYLSKSTEIVLIVVVFENKVHWVDVLEKGAAVNGVVVGAKVTDYLNRDEFQIYGHRDCSLDDIVVLIDGVKALIGYEHWESVYRYKTQNDSKSLEGLIIKGIEL